MDQHEPGLTVATLLQGGKPAQPFETTRSRSALAHLSGAFTNGRSLAVLTSGWRNGSNHLVQRFAAELGTSATLLRIPETCESELEGMQELIRALGFSPRKLSIADLRKVFVNYLDFQNRNKRRTVLILEDSGNNGRWVCDYVTRLVEMDAQAKFGLMIILMRHAKFDQPTDEVPLDSLSYRAAKHIALTPFTQAETRKYIRWRIDAADSADIGNIFEFEAITLIHELCEGMPDAIEHLCCASIALADEEDTAPVTTAIVMKASKDLPAPALMRQPNAQTNLAASHAANIPTLSLPDGPSIVLTYEGRTVRLMPLDQQRISIGRAPENDLCIDSPYISRRHATIFRNGSETAIVDLDSKNGTLVNSRRIQVQAISDQDEICLGYHTIRFLDPNAPRIRTLNSISRGRPAAAGKVHREPPVTDKGKTVRARR